MQLFTWISFAFWPINWCNTVKNLKKPQLQDPPFFFYFSNDKCRFLYVCLFFFFVFLFFFFLLFTPKGAHSSKITPNICNWWQITVRRQLHMALCRITSPVSLNESSSPSQESTITPLRSFTPTWISPQVRCMVHWDVKGRVLQHWTWVWSMVPLADGWLEENVMLVWINGDVSLRMRLHCAWVVHCTLAYKPL